MTDIIRQHNMLPPGSRVLCAVSGGADSVCMLHMLMERRAEMGIELFCAHYEHGLRGEESVRDMAFVQQLCEKWGIVCLAGRGDVSARAREKGMSTEQAAREMRYEFLYSAAEKLGCDRIATAHNADDNAETLIFNLTRGSGLKGLCGIPPVRGKIIRPLLDISRSEIEEYIAANALEYVTDSSNNEDIYSRNLIRHQVMPVLRQLNPALSKAAGRTSALLRQDEELLDSMAEQFIAAQQEGIDACGLCALHKAISGRVIRRLWPRELSLEQIEAVISFAGGSGQGRLDLPGGSLYRERGRLHFEKPESPVIAERQLIPGRTLEIPEAGIRLVSTFTEYTQEINNKFKTSLFKYESICGNIICASRREGDKISPAGRSGSKSVKKLFTELKMTAAEKNMTPILRDDKGVIAVLGHAVDSRCQAQIGDKVLRIDIEELRRSYGERY